MLVSRKYKGNITNSVTNIFLLLPQKHNFKKKQLHSQVESPKRFQVSEEEIFLVCSKQVFRNLGCQRFCNFNFWLLNSPWGHSFPCQIEGRYKREYCIEGWDGPGVVVSVSYHFCSHSIS